MYDLERSGSVEDARQPINMQNRETLHIGRQLNYRAPKVAYYARSCRQHSSFPSLLFSHTIAWTTVVSSMSAAAIANGAPRVSDWPGRYYHVDQVLDRPGPRTDPSFAAGDEVRILYLKTY